MLRPILLATFLLAANLLPAAEPPSFPTDQAAAEALDAPDFILREKAARHLWQRGEAAVPLLQRLGYGPGAGEGESAARARTILENIARGLTPDTPPDLAELIRQIGESEKGNDSGSIRVISAAAPAPKTNPALSEALHQAGGPALILKYVGHLATFAPKIHERKISEAAHLLARAIGTDSPLYPKLLDAVQGPCLAWITTDGFRGNDPAFAYDALTRTLPPDLRPSPERRGRVLEHIGSRKPSPSILNEEAEAIAAAENAAGLPESVPILIEKLIPGDGFPPIGSLTRSLIAQNQLDTWIDKYHKLAAADDAPAHVYSTLAQFLRATEKHHEALAIIQSSSGSNSRNNDREINFALLDRDFAAATKWDAAASRRHHGEDAAAKIAASARFLTSLEDPDASLAVAGTPFVPPFDPDLPLHSEPRNPRDTRIRHPYRLLLATRNYTGYATAASQQENPAFKVVLASEIATVSPPLARQIISGISPDDLETHRGAMGKFLALKRRLREDEPLVEYISTRFATITSEFWDDFLNKYFVEESPDISPVWVFHLLHERMPDRPRTDLMRETLTHGTTALTDADLATLFREFKEASDPKRAYPNGLVISRRLQKFLFPAAPFPPGKEGESVRAATKKITAWAASLPPPDPRRKMLTIPGCARVGVISPEGKMITEYAAPTEEKSASPESGHALLATLTEPHPSAENLIVAGRHHLAVNRPGEAARWLTLAAYHTLNASYFWHQTHKLDGEITFLAAHQSLESALGLQALENADLPTAQRRFQNLCAMGSLDHQLGTALFQKLAASDRKTEAHALFTARWDQLKSILKIAPRDSDVCRALTTWAITCDQLPNEAEAFAELAETLESEHAAQKAHLTRFEW